VKKISERAIEIMVESHRKHVLEDHPVYKGHRTYYAWMLADAPGYPSSKHVGSDHILQALDEYQEAQMRGKEAQALNEVAKW
jgi:hypothetical protein